MRSAPVTETWSAATGPSQLPGRMRLAAYFATTSAAAAHQLPLTADEPARAVAVCSNRDLICALSAELLTPLNRVRSHGLAEGVGVQLACSGGGRYLAM